MGGAVSRTEDGQLVPTFPNAIYWSNEAHWQWAAQPNAREKASFLPENFVPLLESGVLRFAVEGQQLYEGIRVHCVYGHTHAMMLPHLTVGNQTVVYLADLMPSAAHIRLPYVMGYDTQPLLTLEEKARYLSTAAQQHHLLFFEHDPVNECAYVRRNEKGEVEVERVGTLAQLLMVND